MSHPAQPPWDLTSYMKLYINNNIIILNHFKPLQTTHLTEDYKKGGLHHCSYQLLQHC